MTELSRTNLALSFVITHSKNDRQSALNDSFK